MLLHRFRGFSGPGRLVLPIFVSCFHRARAPAGICNARNRRRCRGQIPINVTLKHLQMMQHIGIPAAWRLSVTLCELEVRIAVADALEGKDAVVAATP